MTARLALLAAVAGAALGLALPSAAQERSGEEAYLAECARCHGPDGQGTTWGPAIADDGAAGSHYWMATGRMPIDWPDRMIRPGPPLLPEGEIEAIAGYVAGLGDGPPIPEVELEGADLTLGAELYLLNCAACHGATGVGGALVAGRNASDVLGVEPLQIAEAIRTGPSSMPVYGPETLDQAELNALVAYVVYLQEGPVDRGGIDFGRLGPVTEGAIAWSIGLAVAVLVAVWVEGREPEVGE